MASWLSQIARSVFAPFTPGNVGPRYALRASPVRLRTSSTSIVTFAGTSTSWLTSPPSLSYSSSHGLTVGSPTVTSNTSFWVSVTTGGQNDTVTWTDATYGIQAIQEIRSGRVPIGVLAG